nr:cation:proton antiporter [Crateriforma spongiae]
MHIATTIGMLLAASLLAGLVGEWLRLPKVTAYLIAGLLLGPSVFDLVPHDHHEFLEPLTKLAMALVLFHLGAQFPMEQMRRLAAKAIPLSLGEIFLTVALVTAGLILLDVSGSKALLLGTLAVATAPATTMLVLRETGAAGPVTTMTGTLVTLNNIAAVVLFELVWLGIQLAGGESDVQPVQVLATLGIDLFGSAFLGFLGGLVVSYSCELLSPGRWLVLLIGVSGLLLGISESLDLPYMLTFLVLGVVVVNSSGAAEKIIGQFDSIGGLLTVVFFSVHGSEMNLQLLWQVGTVGVAYVVLRCVGKVLGVYFTAPYASVSREVQVWLGPALLAQAGAAISLATTAKTRDPEMGGDVQAIILGTVIFFEIIGPLLTRRSVLQSGEMPIANSIHHTFGTPMSALRNVWTRLSGSAGLTGREPQTDRMNVEQVMRRSVDGIAESADFNEVLHFVENSHDNTFPVLDDRRAVVGLIRFDLLNQACFDPHEDHLLLASDLATPPEVLLRPSQPVRDAVELFRQTTDDCVPVVSDDSPHVLIGTLRRGDLTNLLIRDRNQKNRQQSKSDQNGDH